MFSISKKLLIIGLENLYFQHKKSLNSCELKLFLSCQPILGRHKTLSDFILPQLRDDS